MAITTTKLTRQEQNKKEETTAIDQQLVRLEEDVRRLKIEFDIYFNGGGKRAPHESRGRVESNIKRIADNRNLSYAQRYLFNALVARYTRVNLLEAKTADYVRTARAKGATTASVTWRHALRNALVPILTVVGISAGYLMGGSILVETVFSWPGTGLLLNSAIFQRDLPVLQGTILVLAMFFVALNLLVDLVQTALDPRIKRA
mgnify:CR=1 FL=1